MEATTAVRRHLLGLDPVRSYVQDRVYRWRLEEPVLGTGRRAIVVSQQPGWAAPDPVKSQEYPVVWIDCYADPDREASGAVAVLNAEDKAWAVARVLMPLLHGVRDVWWGAVGSSPGLKVISAARWQDPRLVTAGDRHKEEPELGESVFVRTVWALQTMHGEKAGAV